MTIYIDSLFLVNFFMDTAILFTVSVLRRRQYMVMRIFAGALFSALYGTLAFFPSLSFMYGALFKLVISVATILISYGGKGFRDAIYSWASFWLVSAAAGGIILLLASFTDFGRIVQIMLSNHIVYANLNPILLVIGCGVLYLLIEVHRRMSVRNFSRERIILNVNVVYMGSKYRLTTLIDTGCELTEPLSGAPVLLAEKRIFSGVEPSGAKIYVQTASGEGELPLIFPERVDCIDKRWNITAKTAIALTENKFCCDGLYNSIINPDAVGDGIERENIINPKYKLTDLK